MGDIGAPYVDRPTVAKMMSRDVFSYTVISTPVMWLAVTLLVSSLGEAADDAEAFDATTFYAIFLALIGISTALVYWRWRMYSSVLTSGVEVPGEVKSVRRSGDAVVVEYAYRWQGETVTSARRISGYLPKRKLKEQVGAKATLLVDPSKPTRFLVLDSVR